MAFFQVFQAFTQLFEMRIVKAFPQPTRNLDFNFFSFLIRIRGTQDGFQHVGIKDECFQVIMDSVDVDMLVNEIDSFRSQGMPEETPTTRRWLNRLINLR